MGPFWDRSGREAASSRHLTSAGPPYKRKLDRRRRRRSRAIDRRPPARHKPPRCRPPPCGPALPDCGGGAVAQLGERCNRTAEVRGSNPLSSTSVFNHLVS